MRPAKYLEANIPSNNNIQELQCENKNIYQTFCQNTRIRGPLNSPISVGRVYAQCPTHFHFYLYFNETNVRHNNNIQEPQSENNMLRASWLKNERYCPGIFGVLKSISKLMMYHFIRLTITHKIYILHQSWQYFEDKFYIHVKVVISLQLKHHHHLFSLL